MGIRKKKRKVGVGLKRNLKKRKEKWNAWPNWAEDLIFSFGWFFFSFDLHLRSLIFSDHASSPSFDFHSWNLDLIFFHFPLKFQKPSFHSTPLSNFKNPLSSLSISLSLSSAHHLSLSLSITPLSIDYALAHWRRTSVIDNPRMLPPSHLLAPFNLPNVDSTPRHQVEPNICGETERLQPKVEPQCRIPLVLRFVVGEARYMPLKLLWVCFGGYLWFSWNFFIPIDF